MSANKNFHRKIKITLSLLARFSCASDMFGVWIARCSGAFFEWNAQVGAENRPSACQALVLESMKLPRVRTVPTELNIVSNWGNFLVQ